MHSLVRYSTVLIALTVVTAAQGATITLRTGQVGGAPGSCQGLDQDFHTYTPQQICGAPILSTPFGPADFEAACAGPNAVVINPHPAWGADLPCDLDARWINYTADAVCNGTPLSTLYCARFDSECTLADSIVVCWQVDDALGDPVAWPGPNPDGVYVNGVTLGPAFSNGNNAAPTTAVAYNVPLTGGSNQFQVYQRDAGCAVSGLILSTTIYTSCGSTPVEDRSWGSIKATYR